MLNGTSSEIQTGHGEPQQESHAVTAEDVRRLLEYERKMTNDVTAQLLVQIRREMIPEVVAELPALQGPAGPPGPPGKLPIAKDWKPETVFYKGEVATFDGASYQARRDTGERPDNPKHWRCLAAPGRDAKSLRHRGTYRDGAEYAALDMVALNGGTFLSLRDKPGPCPGSGWQLMSAPGKRGERGAQGERGPAGIAGPPGKEAAIITGWDVDRTSYCATPIMSDGSLGPPLPLRGLFEQFWGEVR